MKPSSPPRILILALFTIAFVACDQKPSESVVDATEAAAIKAAADRARLQATHALQVAQELRDEAEGLRLETEIRQASIRLAEEKSAPGDKAAPPAGEVRPVAIAEENPPRANQIPDSENIIVLPPVAKAPPALETEVSYEPFYDALADQGTWMESPDYGYVWQPSLAVSVEWEPYTDGGWCYTDCGWTWTTTETFGPICYHYGRWTRLRRIGWVWVPGREWAPAWVSWRHGQDCVGWAPLPPRVRWSSSVGIHSWADSVGCLTPSSYCFVSIENIFHPRCREIRYPKPECDQRFLATRNVTRFTAHKRDARSLIRCDGPPVDAIRDRVGSKFREHKLQLKAASGHSHLANATSQDGDNVNCPEWKLNEKSAKKVKPKSVDRKLDSSLDVVSAPAREHRDAIRKLTMQEATNSLEQLPARPQQLRGKENPKLTLREANLPSVQDSTQPAAPPLHPKIQVSPPIKNPVYNSTPAVGPKPSQITDGGAKDVERQRREQEAGKTKPENSVVVPASAPKQQQIADRGPKDVERFQREQKAQKAKPKNLVTKPEPAPKPPQISDRGPDDVDCQQRNLATQQAEEQLKAEQRKESELQQPASKSKLDEAARQRQIAEAEADKKKMLEKQQADQKALRKQVAEEMLTQGKFPKQARQEAVQQQKLENQQRQEETMRKQAAADEQRKQLEAAQQAQARQEAIQQQKQEAQQRQQQEEVARRQQEEAIRRQQEAQQRQQEEAARRQQEAQQRQQEAAARRQQEAQQRQQEQSALREREKSK